MFPFVFLILGFAMASILLGLAIFALAAPKAFAKWMSPFFWITRRIYTNRPDRWDHWMSYGVGYLCLLSMLVLQFFMGGFVATMFFNLWYSPFAFLIR